MEPYENSKWDQKTKAQEEKAKPKWNAGNDVRKWAIINVLGDHDCLFKELLDQVNQKWKALGEIDEWSRHTLALYLDALKEEGIVIHKGSRKGFTLNYSHPDVKETLGNIPEVGDLSPSVFVDEWLSSVQFTLLIIMKDFAAEKINQLLQSHIQDLLELNAFYGDLVQKRIHNHQWEQKEVEEALSNLQKRVVNWKGEFTS